MDLGKSVRHRALRELVSRRGIRTQRELVTALRGQGIPSTQATMSRDITELGLTKAERNGSIVYVLPPGGSVEQAAEERLRALVRETTLEPGDLVAPLFVCHGQGVRRPIASMPGHAQLSVDEAVKEAKEIAALNPTLGAFITVMPEAAIEEAKAADALFASGVDRGPLQGIPMAAKDIIATKTAPTTANSVVLDRAWGAGYDAAVVERLRAAGAVFVGKSVLSEFANGAPDPSKPFQIGRAHV